MIDMTAYLAGSIVLTLDRDGRVAQATRENTRADRDALLVAVLTPAGELHVVKDRHGRSRTFRAEAQR